MKQKLISILLLLASVTAYAEVKLEPIFSDGMILQQQSQASIWGTSDSKKKSLTIVGSWDKKEVSASIDKSGNWSAKLSTPSYGGPYTITINDGDSKTLNNVLIGEVWIASGQSNMEMPMEGFNSQPVEKSGNYIARSYDPQLRILSVKHTVSATPLTTVNSDGWSESNSAVVAPMSATAYHFARMLREGLGIPIGIIESSWGGTSINSWVTPEFANSYQDVKDREKKSSPNSQHFPGGLHNAMINPIAGYTAKGFLWYQGESDRMRSSTYAQKMLDMVSTWRKMWGNEDMPFYYAQIAPFEYTLYGAHDLDSHYMREAMEDAQDVIPLSGMVCLSDAGLERCIHPSNKEVVGERFAYQALRKTYNQMGVVADGPRFKSIEVKDGKMTVTFDNAELGMSTFGEELRDFEIAGEDGIFYEAKGRIRLNTVILSCDKVPSPVKVQYGFRNWFKGNLYNLSGIPASSFRSHRE